MSAALSNTEVGAVVAEYTSDVITRETLALYAEASGDNNPLHLDPAFAKQAGFDDVIVHGMLGMALLGRLLTENFPVENLRGFNSRFGAPIPVGNRIRCRATLASRTTDAVTLNLDAMTEDASTVYISGSATLATGA